MGSMLATATPMATAESNNRVIIRIIFMWRVWSVLQGLELMLAASPRHTTSCAMPNLA